MPVKRSVRQASQPADQACTLRIPDSIHGRTALAAVRWRASGGDCSWTCRFCGPLIARAQVLAACIRTPGLRAGTLTWSGLTQCPNPRSAPNRVQKLWKALARLSELDSQSSRPFPVPVLGACTCPHCPGTAPALLVGFWCFCHLQEMFQICCVLQRSLVLAAPRAVSGQRWRWRQQGRAVHLAWHTVSRRPVMKLNGRLPKDDCSIAESLEEALQFASYSLRPPHST